ncbi:unnamed protein product [Cylicocyclus nassatus]|uniref:Uncharacterized protein n=1 Tax=Cylicocyclus nassatus TaxID=53992 RepID=A0AA36MA88_CYLNA|nr:unnamed protein product [Cylicocyclus nassatus]
MGPLPYLVLFTLPFYSLATSCEMLKKSHYDYTTLLKKGAATDLKICTGKNACCTKSIEEEIVQNTQKIFKAQLEDKILVLRHMINSHLNSFRTYFYNSLNACHEQLDALFGRTYGPFYQSNSQVFETFFNRLRAFSSPFSEAKVPQITSQLFEDMFVIMFQLMNPMHSVTSTQRRCMLDGMAEIAPFGDVPEKLAMHLEKPLVLWKHFVFGLDNVYNVLEGFMNISTSKECNINLARMWDCSLCTGGNESKACPGLCLNVMKGCLGDWAEMDQQWNIVIDSLLKLSTRIRSSQNLHNSLQPLPVQISEAVMEMQERGVTVSNKVLARCYPIEELMRSSRHQRSTRPRRHVRHRSLTDRTDNYGKVLNSLMSTFSERFEPLRGWFSALPTTFCTDSGLVAKEGESCWNGNETAPYTKEIAGDGLAKQSTNPEYQADRFLPYRGLFIDERLRLGMLSFRLQNVLHGYNYTNYQVVEGSGDSDDEDYDEGSGLSIVSLYSTESTEQTVEVQPHTSTARIFTLSLPLLSILLYLTRFL